MNPFSNIQPYRDNAFINQCVDAIVPNGYVTRQPTFDSRKVQSKRQIENANSNFFRDVVDVALTWVTFNFMSHKLILWLYLRVALKYLDYGCDNELVD